MKRGVMIFMMMMGMIGCRTTEKVVVVDQVPADFPVNFSLLTEGDEQYVAYYDTLHVLTVGCRKLDAGEWKFKKLDTKVGWDSHNYIAMFMDPAGYMHVCGNMHSDDLKYFRSARPRDIASLVRMDSMVGQEEDVTTYPEFMRGPNGEVLFHYRYGRSGNGYEIYNILDVETQRWRRLLDRPLINGEGAMSAYMQGPIVGPDGYYHLIWVWRNTPDCSTNHTLSYARSRDLLHWESIRGEEVDLPITFADSVLVVDPTPVKGGLINIGIKLGFDSRQRPVIGYHKYDAAGHTQLMLSRFEDGIWKQQQQTQWDYRWDFKGWGTIVNELLIDAPEVVEDGKLRFVYHRQDSGDGEVITDENTLMPLSEGAYTKDYPAEMDEVASGFPGMLVYKMMGEGVAKDGSRYMLRWEALSPNRDQKRKGEVPGPSVLTVWKVK